MYTSDINSKKAVKTAFIYLLISLFLIVFGAVYEIFSHEVYSFYMIYAFIFPLAGGTLPYFIIHLKQIERYPNAFTGNLYHSGIATLTVGSIIQGILNIYGTTNALTIIYPFAGIILIILAIIIFCFQILLKK